ncbi:restriction endonuclease subunit S [Colwellia sp. M166]|uniref:restriction endonuclease subunit S n=1 Tax=Colwellia sp. M166 TaxID=2583805 RepID=UPI00211F052F|nr:restriction endonuclease subunit S [Colwellia sp. M166]UUO22875.1 restriction endonuclease subunit S [Colwellia sp. M166]|tara:strand:+ start:757 stop:2532 length:1776 start_codon:yes stop_codon:yes gene_type:complete
MAGVEKLITEHIDVWTSAIKKRNATGRGTSKKIELTGIKKLRELILELAVRGKLVPQDASDEPASVLLEKISQIKQQLISNKTIKKTRKQPEISTEDQLYTLPSGWAWARLEDVYDVRDGTHDSPKAQLTGYPLVTSKNLSSGKLDLSDIKYISEADHLKIIARSKVDRDDILFAMIGSIGNPVIVDLEPDFSIKNVGLFKYFDKDLSVPLFLKNYLIYASVIIKSQSGGGVQPFVSLGKLRSFVISLPPLAEQHRIVAKVDELMALCDQLEQQTEQSLSAHQTLVEVLLASLTNGTSADDDNKEDFQTSWQRIAEHFDVLFTTEASIEQLKQTILQLAVMGKLVPQNPNDEPASVLLDKIAEEKAQLIADKKIKKQKPLPAITDEEKPFELPNGWEWTTLSHIGVFTGGKTPSKANSDYWNGDVPWVTPKDMKVEEIFDSEDHVTKLAITDGLAQIDTESLLFVARSGILRRKFPVAITKSVCTVNQDLKVLSLIDKYIANYVLLMMKGFEMYILENLTKIGTTVESLRFDDFSKHYFIMPPLKEQQRIVAKVDELLALCDQLKARLGDAQTTQLHLADAVVENALGDAL